MNYFVYVSSSLFLLSFGVDYYNHRYLSFLLLHAGIWSYCLGNVFAYFTNKDLNMSPGFTLKPGDSKYVRLTVLVFTVIFSILTLISLIKGIDK